MPGISKDYPLCLFTQALESICGTLIAFLTALWIGGAAGHIAAGESVFFTGGDFFSFEDLFFRFVAGVPVTAISLFLISGILNAVTGILWIVCLFLTLFAKRNRIEYFLLFSLAVFLHVFVVLEYGAADEYTWLRFFPCLFAYPTLYGLLLAIKWIVSKKKQKKSILETVEGSRV